MSKWFSIVAIAVAMAFGSFVKADDAKEATPAKPLHGKVTAVTKDTSGTKIVSFTISSHGKAKGDPAIETVIAVSDNTKVTKEDAALTLADVAVGTVINATLGGGDDKKTATKIEISVHKKKPAAPAAAK